MASRRLSGSHKVVAATAGARAGSSWLRFLPTDGKQQSRLGTGRFQLPHAFGLWASLRHPIFTTGSMPFWLADAEKVITALSVLFSFQYLLRLFPRDALHRFTAHSGHWPFAGDSEASDWQPMALGDGTPEWADSLFQGEFEAFVFLFLQLSTSSTGSLRPSLRSSPAYWLDFRSYLTTDASNFQSAPDPSGGRGEMAMVAPLLPSLLRHSRCSRADLTALDRKFPQFLCFGCHFKSPQGWQFERSPYKDGRSKETDPWEKGVFQRPRRFLLQVSPPPWVRQAYAERTTGTPPPGRRVPLSVSPRVGFSRWSSTLRPLVCLGAHKVSTRPPRGRCSLSWTALGSKSSGRPVAFEHNEGPNPKTGRVRDPFNQKDLAKRQVHVMDQQ